MLLTVSLATPIRRPNSDGTGYSIRNAYCGHGLQLQIGNVSIAFDGRDVWECADGDTYGNPILQFSEYTDCPIRLGNDDCPKCADSSEALLFALAADLGYSIRKQPSA